MNAIEHIVQAGECGCRMCELSQLRDDMYAWKMRYGVVPQLSVRLQHKKLLDAIEDDLQLLMEAYEESAAA